MGKRGPKPRPVEETRRHIVYVRLTDREYQALQRAKKETGAKSDAETLRDAAFSEEDG
jgi:hypothetical protein